MDAGLMFQIKNPAVAPMSAGKKPPIVPTSGARKSAFTSATPPVKPSIPSMKLKALLREMIHQPDGPDQRRREEQRHHSLGPQKCRASERAHEYRHAP